MLSRSITLLLGNPKSKNLSLPPFALSAPDPILSVAPSLPKKMIIQTTLTVSPIMKPKRHPERVTPFRPVQKPRQHQHA
ncbi:hypothetical protein FCM35_KLT15266 [Carex littledalei]|uniref:Uncharacterized protein n=1 Tax=Carex littledalei TaxID=544730 RepID=A0A833QA87_9POAL|nr:hypothetical protein FCM35_KLT15266 [Carex littledalei]